MAVFLVTYDLNKETSRPPIVKFIRETWNFAMLSESSYAVEGDSASNIYDALSSFIDENDDLFVIPLKRPYEGWGQKIVHQWLHEKLTY